MRDGVFLVNAQTAPEVLFFLPRLGGGGAEMNAVRLAPGLLAAGVRPVYAVGRGPGGYEDFLPEGVEVIVLDTGKINSSVLRLVRARSPLAKLIDERKPDVVCPVMVAPSLSALAAVRKAKHKPKVVLSIQNSLSVSHEQSKRVRDKIELALLKRMFPHSNGVIALSQGVADEIARIVPETARDMQVIYNVGYPLKDQLDTALAQPRPSSEGTIVLLACGRLTRQKDYPTLFEAFAKLRGDVRLDILGDGELKAGLEQKCQELGITDRVKFLGFQRDPISHMRRADVFVLSSLWEGFGNVLVEAMSVSTPVVSTDCPHGPGEILTQNENGLLVPTSDPDALAAALQRMVDDPALRLRIGTAGEKRAQDFQAGAIGAAYAEAFRGYLKE